MKRIPIRLIPSVVFGLCVLGALSCSGSSDGEPDAQPTPASPQLGQAGGGPSIEELFQGIERNPSDPDAHHRLALALHGAGRRDEAVTHFEILAELRPAQAHLVELGVAYASVNRPDDAEATFRRVLETAPEHPVVLHHLGNLARGRGDTNGAIELYRQAIKSEPNYLIAQFNLAETLRQAMKYEDAYRGYETVVGMEPKGNPELQAFDQSLFQLGMLDLQMGATERAVQFFEALLQTVPDHPEAHLALGQALMKLGRQEEARDQVEIHQRLAAQADGGRT